jgi:hypothetical protein
MGKEDPFKMTLQAKLEKAAEKVSFRVSVPVWTLRSTMYQVLAVEMHRVMFYQ